MNEEAVITETRQYLTFKLGDEVFALEVLQVREILDMTTITKVPRSPDFMRGVINVRGSVIPVVDIRSKFGMPQVESTVDTRIVVMEISLDGEETVIGALADSVHEVMDLEPGQVEPPPKIGGRWRSEFIKGIGKHNDEFIILLDIDMVFSQDELTLLSEEGSTAVLGEMEAAA